MSTSQEPYNGPNTCIYHTQATHRTQNLRMYDPPDELSPAQIEAKKILVHILDEFKDMDSKYYAKYGRWAERHTSLSEFCFHCVRPPVWAFLDGRWSLDALKNIGGDLRSANRGVYLNGVLGLDKRVRIYIGQASNIRLRIAQHLNFRHRRDNPSLHYHAFQLSIYNTIGSLAILPSPNMGNQTLPGMDDPALLLNLLEIWMCLIFRTLPPQTLIECMPAGVDAKRKLGKEGEFGGLNIANPLDQGAGGRVWVDLSDSEDALIQDYLNVEAEKASRLSVRGELKGASEADPHAATKKAYAEKAQRRNAVPQNNIRLPPGTIIAVGVAAVVGFALWRGNAGLARR